MNTLRPSSQRLFGAGVYDVLELTEDDLPTLQDFLVANPEYFLSVNGMLPRPDEARREFEDRPPPEMPYDKVYVIGFSDSAGRMMGAASVLCNLFVPGVWHIGLYIIDTSLHGTGTAGALYAHLETWAKEEGATWLRLGVVVGNVKAERFWEKVGYEEVRRRTGMQLGDVTHTIRVLVKPLGNSGLEEYLRLVARDRPES